MRNLRLAPLAVLLLAAAAAEEPTAPTQPTASTPPARGGPAMNEPVVITVGQDEGVIRGNDHRALQAAVDYVANLGGGVVRVGPGRYTLRNALFLRNRTRVVGVPGQTVLAACDGAESRLALDGDCNERQVTLADPAAFRSGDGISVQDKKMGGGFGVTTATLLDKAGPDAFRITTPLYYDYMVANGATARLTFPLVAGYQVRDAGVEGLSLDGNREKAQPLNGCRGGGIYLFECERVAIRNCAVRKYNGDGISFQVSAEVTVEDCVVEDCAGLGLHPGSGSSKPVLRRNRSLGNGGDGLFVCWRVKNGLFEENVVEGNRGVGLSIGHKDTDNLFRKNRIAGNAKDGVLFRREDEPMAAHRNVFEENEILDNGLESPEAVPVRILGRTNDLVFRRNVIGYSKATEKPAFKVGPDVKGLTLEANELRNVKGERAGEK
jgi:hypothetical protein